MDNFDEVLVAAAVGGVVLVGLLLLGLSFGTTLARVLRRVSPENRLMEPGQVWLNLIPLFNVLWLPITVDRIAWSVRNEFAARGQDDPAEGYGRGVGLTGLILLILPWFFENPGLIALLLLLTLGFGVAYWAKMSGYARRLKGEGRRPYVPPAHDEW